MKLPRTRVVLSANEWWSAFNNPYVSELACTDILNGRYAPVNVAVVATYKDGSRLMYEFGNDPKSAEAFLERVREELKRT